MTGDTAELLRKWGSLLQDDHFVYVSGQHGSGWIDKDIVYPHTERTSALGALIAGAVAGRDIEVVCGPATGGLILAQWVAHHLGGPGGVRRARGPDRAGSPIPMAAGDSRSGAAMTAWSGDAPCWWSTT